MKVESTVLPGVLLLSPAVRGDARGTFHESWQLARYRDAGLPTDWVQDNVSRSRRGVLRGLHFQHPEGQGKLISVLAGVIMDAAVDIRTDSPAFGEAMSVTLSSEDGRQLYVPPGFAHGFLVLSDEAIVHYKCTDYYRPEAEGAIAWDDPSLAIPWPITHPILSAKDAAARPLSALAEDALPRRAARG